MPSLKPRVLLGALCGVVCAAAGVAVLLTPGSAGAGVNEWTPVSPGGVNITALALSPAFPCDKTGFMGTDGGGVFRTTSGDSDDSVWEPVNNGLTDPGISSLAVSPNYNRCDRAFRFNQGDQTVIVGTHTGLILLSVDAGVSWAAITNGLPLRSSPPSYAVGALAISPNYASDRTIYAALQATRAGGATAVYRTTDQGAVWFPFDAGLPDRSVQAFALSPNFANDATLFAGTRFSGIYRFAGTLSRPSFRPGPTATATATSTPAPAPAAAGTPRPTGTPRIARADAAPMPSRETAGSGPEGEGTRLQNAPGSLVFIKRAGSAAPGAVFRTAPGPVVFEYEVKNVSQDPTDVLRNLTVVDDNGTPGDIRDDVQIAALATLDPGGAFQVFRKTLEVTKSATNIATARALQKDSDPNTAFVVTSSASVEVVTGPPFVGLKLIMRAGNAADGATLFTPPGPVEYSYDLRNVGETVIRNIAVTDDGGTPGDATDDIQVGMIDSIPPGTRTVLLRTVEVSKDINRGATATGFHGTLSDIAVTATDGAAVAVRLPTPVAVPPPAPPPGAVSMKLVVTAGGALDGQISYNVPGPVVFQYRVINDGLEPLTNIRVTDGGLQGSCGDDPATPDSDEGLDDLQVGTIGRLDPGQEATLNATFSIFPATVGPITAATVLPPQRRVGCALAASASAGPVRAQDDATVQLVVWTSITPTNTEMSDLWIWSFGISPFFANDQTVFAGSAFGGLFKSSDAGSGTPTWKRVNAGLEPEWASVRAIVLSPHYPDDRTVFVGTERGIFRGVETLDGGVRWTALSRGLRLPDTRALAISPNFNVDQVVYAGVWGDGLYRLRNGGTDAEWVSQRRVADGRWAWATGITYDGVLLAGTWGTSPNWPGIIGRNVVSANRGWEFPALPAAAGGEATAFAISTSCPTNEIFAGTWDRGLFKSIDGGRTWLLVPLPTDAPIRSISLSPNYYAGDRTVFVATWGAGIFRGVNGGETWTSINAGLPDLLTRAVLAPPTYPSDGVLFAGTDNAGVFRWEPSLSRWSPAGFGLPDNRIMALAASPLYAEDGTLAAATWGGGAALSYDRGNTWIQSMEGLGSPYVRAVAFAQDFAGRRFVYAGTNLGPFRSTDGGASWARLGSPGDSLDGLDVTGFAMHARAPGTVYASTGGRGIWVFTEGNSTLGVRPPRLTTHLDPKLPFHTFVALVYKSGAGPSVAVPVC